MKISLKSKMGATTIDLSIAMIVILIFVIIMTSVSYNIYLSSIEAKRTAVALNYAVDIFEHIGSLDFGEVTASYDIFDISSLAELAYTGISSNSGTETVSGKLGTYEIDMSIQDYKGDGVVKLIKLTITYPVSRKKTEKIEMQRLKIIDNS